MSYAVSDRDLVSELFSAQSSFSDEIYNEIRKQLERKLMTYLPGIPMNTAMAVELYSNSIHGVQRIHQTHLNKDGSINSNPNNFGNVYEEQEVTALNRYHILQNSPIRAERTDNLADKKQIGDVLPDSLDAYAIKHHEYIDIVAYDEVTGEVVKTYQVKHTRGSNILTQEAYTSSEHAPDAILVPKDMEKRHQEKLDSISQRAHKEENRSNAVLAKQKLEPGHLDSSMTERPDKDEHPCLHELTTNYANIVKTIPYIHQGTIIAADAISRVGGRLALDSAAVIVGGVLYELHDAWKYPGQMGYLDRIKRIFVTALEKIKSLIKDKGLQEICLEIVTGLFGLVSSMFKNLKALFKTLSQGIHQIADRIWDFIAGKIRNFGELVSSVLKILCDVGIVTCAVAVEEYLTKQFPWIPDIVAGVGAAAAAGLAIVFANRGIDLVIGTLAGMFSEADAARLHRERVEAFIQDNLPKILDDTNRIEEYAKIYLDRQKELHSRSFKEIQSLFFSDSRMFQQALNTHAEIFGAKTITDNFLDDLENELMAFARNKH